MAAVVDQGLEERNDFLSMNGSAGVGYSPVSITDDGTRYNTAFAYLDDLREKGCRIIPHCNSNTPPPVNLPMPSRNS
ncbi:Probable glucose-methanol-choline oxidoreductase [Mycobacteroides abscessus subsp. abscessus]|nr:Probable glucose-methanol-choline oxidoreductase [Mycobacteroides abscessus subsp. abscessus]